MNRYLINISYIGTAFRGVTKIAQYYKFCDRSTILGEIEYTLKKELKPINEVISCFTLSRTDARVHAIQSPIVVDLERRNGQPYDPTVITTKLNTSFLYRNIEIRIINTQIVPVTFDHHSIEKRSYLYRLAVTKKKYLPSDQMVLWVPIEEAKRCLFLGNYDFQINRMMEVAPMFVGKHDFRSFMKESKEEKTKSATFPIRKIESFTIEQGKPCVTSINKSRCENDYDYWNLKFTGTSFVYRQIRRIVNTLISVAKGELTKRDVYEMLTIPTHSWPCNVAPARGLYLSDIKYVEGSTVFCEINENDNNLKNVMPELKEIT